MKKLLLFVTLFIGVISFAQEKFTDSTLVLSILSGNENFVAKWIDINKCEGKDFYNLDDVINGIIVSNYVKCTNDGKEKYFLEGYKQGNLVYFETKLDSVVNIFEKEKTVQFFIDQFETLSDSEKLNLEKFAREVSELEVKYRREEETNNALKYLKSFEKYGIAISEAVPTDNYGMTGAKFRIFNASKKTIKYITFNFYGKNAVKDKVFSYGKSGFSAKGIGPIEEYAFADYQFDSVWLTDIVQTLTLTSVNILYMNGTSKNIIITDNMWIDEDELEPIYKN